MSNLMPFLGFASLGFLLGYIAGLSSGEIANYFLGLVVAFFGGSVGFYIKNSNNNRLALGSLLFSFSLFCIIGLSSGIFIKTNRLLSVNEEPAFTRTELSYLKSMQTNDRLTKIRGYLDKIYKETNNEEIKKDIDKIQQILRTPENE